jgi:hypothetical protein
MGSEFEGATEQGVEGFIEVHPSKNWEKGRTLHLSFKGHRETLKRLKRDDASPPGTSGVPREGVKPFIVL